ncbi:MAG TPA: fibronectin type III domain-containing protein [Solirubrobacteraceae bacterium]
MRTRIIAVIIAGAALALSVTGVAEAATPVVVTGHVGRITSTSAVLHGTVNPGGVDTDYTFNYGVTTSYGTATAARSAGTGTKQVAVAEKITGLLPGTTYHFQLTAVSAAGSAVGADVTFTTGGSPPSIVTTGAAVSVGTEKAGVTGTIVPNDASTTWYVQYGLTTAYGVQTYPQTLVAGSVPDPVGATLTGLAPSTLFHYRIVAFHGAVTSFGADGTFFTRPLHPPKPGLHARTSPGRDRRAPYTFTTSGSLRGGHFIPAGDRCTGTVDVRFYNGRHRLASGVADVGANCSFTVHTRFRHSHGKGRVPVRVVVAYAGNGYLAASTTTDHVTVGR